MRPLWVRGTASDRIEVCHARARLQLADGNAAGAERQLERGLQLLDDYRAALGAVELRATASGFGTELSQLGLRMAIESRDSARVLRWAERLRASALRLPSVRPPTDRKLNALQVDLRRAIEQRAAGRQSKLEAAIRARTRLVPGEGGATHVLPDPRETADALAIACRARRARRHAERADAMNGHLTIHDPGLHGIGELDWLRFALARSHGAHTRRAHHRAVNAGRRRGARRRPRPATLPTIGEAPLVLVPTGPHAIRERASLRGRALVVTPSLSVWPALDRRPARGGADCWIAGPRPRHAAGGSATSRALRELSVLTGPAPPRRPLHCADGAVLAHIACHGHFRSDSPLFSSLELADGPLNVYELQTLRQAPDMVVLSACDLATSDLHPGDEVLGLAAALLAMGTRTIIASVVPVPDAGVKRLMLAFHRNLLAGDKPAVALARAQSRASVAGFVCLGSG